MNGGVAECSQLQQRSLLRPPLYLSLLADSIIRHIINGDTVLTYTKPRLMAGAVAGFDPAQLPEGKSSASKGKLPAHWA